MDDSIRKRKPTDPPPADTTPAPGIDQALRSLVRAMTGLDAAVVRGARAAGATEQDAQRAAEESRAIAADLAYNRLKNNGGLQRAEADRALRLQIERPGSYTASGFWA